MKKFNNFKFTTKLSAIGAIAAIIFVIFSFAIYQSNEAMKQAQLMGMFFFLMNFAIVICAVIIIVLGFPVIFSKEQQVVSKWRLLPNLLITLFIDVNIAFIYQEIVINPYGRMGWNFVILYGLLAAFYNLFFLFLLIQCHFYMPKPEVKEIVK